MNAWMRTVCTLLVYWTWLIWCYIILLNIWYRTTVYYIYCLVLPYTAIYRNVSTLRLYDFATVQHHWWRAAHHKLKYSYTNSIIIATLTLTWRHEAFKRDVRLKPWHQVYKHTVDTVVVLSGAKDSKILVTQKNNKLLKITASPPHRGVAVLDEYTRAKCALAPPQKPTILS